MDLDFRKPKIHKIFKTVNTFGIVEYILGECSFEELVKKTEYGVDVFNRGNAASNASVIFMGEKFKALLEKLKCDYDVVLFDCPPVLRVSDYIHLAKLSSGVLFVVSCEKARRSQVKEAVSALKNAGANVMGSAVTFSGKGGLGKNYGHELHRLMGRTLNDNLVSLVMTSVTETLCANPYIRAVSLKEYAIEGSRLTLTISVTTIYDRLEITEVYEI